MFSVIKSIATIIVIVLAFIIGYKLVQNYKQKQKYKSTNSVMLYGGGMSSQKQHMCMEGDAVFILHTRRKNLFENTLYDNIKRVLEKYGLKYIEDEKDSLSEYKDDDFFIIDIYTYLDETNNITNDVTIDKHNDINQSFYFLEKTDENIKKVRSTTYRRRTYHIIVGDEKK